MWRELRRPCRTPGSRPELARVGEEFAKAVQITRFSDIGLSAEVERSVYVRLEGRATENGGGNDTVLRMFLHPAENIEAAGAGHFEVEKEKGRKRVELSVGIQAAALQVRDGVFAVRDNVRRLLQRNVAKSPAEE